MLLDKKILNLIGSTSFTFPKSTIEILEKGKK